MSHSILVDVVQAFVFKWHSYGIQSLNHKDLADLDNALGQELARHEEMESAVEEFADAMDTPRGTAADQRRVNALRALRRVRAEIKRQREAHAGRDFIEQERSFPQV